MLFAYSVDGGQVVALLAEGVDRNAVCVTQTIPASKSPSSRRAWIEIDGGGHLLSVKSVALLAEGVDRNKKASSVAPAPQVALLAEGVDRNFERTPDMMFSLGHPPRREHRANPLSIRLCSPSFLQAGHRFGGRQPFSIQNQRRDRVLRSRRWSFFRVGPLLQAPAVQTADDLKRHLVLCGQRLF